jgi:glycosyltransferase involved in cell wall biosynthesis
MAARASPPSWARCRRRSCSGPIGGGEAAPLRLVWPLGWMGFAIEAVRLSSNWLSRNGPINALKYAQADRILCRTPETVPLVPKRHRHKVKLLGEVGVGAYSAPEVEAAESDAGYYLFSARFLYWKGGEIALRAFARYRQAGGDATLIMVGQGPSTARWRKLSQRLGIDDAVTWVGWLERHKFIEMLKGARGLLFPSLHDAGGNVVYEALLSGTPVLSLELGGPGRMLFELGIPTIKAHGRTFDQVVADLTEQMLHPEALHPALHRESIERYFATHGWDDLVGMAFADYLPAPETTPAEPRAEYAAAAS